MLFIRVLVIKFTLCTLFYIACGQQETQQIAQLAPVVQPQTKAEIVQSLAEQPVTIQLPTQTQPTYEQAGQVSKKAAEKITTQVRKAQKALKKVKKTAKKLVQAFVLEPEIPFPPFQSRDVPSKAVGNKTEVSACVTASLEGRNSIVGAQVNEGMQMVFNNLSAEQPDTQYFTKIFSIDDKSETLKVRENVKELEKDSPLFLSMMGDDILFASLAHIVRNHLLVLFPISGVDALRSEKFRNLVFFRPSYEKEIEALTSYVVYRLRRKKIAIFYEESDWGNECKKKVVKILQKFDLKPVEAASYPDGSVNVSDAVDRISKKSPNVVFCIATSRPASTFVRLAINKGLYNATFLGFSELVPIQKVLSKLRGARMITSAIVPDPLRSNLPLAQDFRNAMQKYLPNQAVGSFHFEGYINAIILMKVLNMIQPPVTTEKIIATLEGFKNFDLKGLPLTFDPKTRTLSNQVWINRGEDAEFIPSQAIKMDE